MYIIVNSAYTERDKWVEGEYVYFGPFDTKEDAEKWAEAEYEHWGWWVVKLWEAV